MDEDEDSGVPEVEEAEQAAFDLMDWWLLHDRKFAPYDRKFVPHPTQFSQEDDRRFWGLTAKLVAGFADQIDGGREPDQSGILPADPLRMVAASIEEAVAGSPPRAWVSRGKGYKGRSPAGPKRVGIGYARAYYAAIEDGLIADSAHNKTIRTLYGVEDDAVQNWLKLPRGLQSRALRISLLRLEGTGEDLAQRRLQLAKDKLAHGAHFYKMGRL